MHQRHVQQYVRLLSLHCHVHGSGPMPYGELQPFRRLYLYGEDLCPRRLPHERNVQPVDWELRPGLRRRLFPGCLPHDRVLQLAWWLSARTSRGRRNTLPKRRVLFRQCPQTSFVRGRYLYGGGQRRLHNVEHRLQVIHVQSLRSIDKLRGHERRDGHFLSAAWPLLPDRSLC